MHNPPPEGIIIPPPLPPTMPDGMYLDLLLDPSPLDDGPASEGGAGAVAAPPRTKVPKPLDFFMEDLRGFADRSGFEGCRTACESLENEITCTINQAEEEVR